MDKRTRLTITAYNKIAPQYAVANRTYTFWKDEFGELKRRINGRRVLEIGCGAGRDATVFLKDGFDYLGVDASRGLLAIAKRQNPRGRFRKMSFYALNLPRHSFDAVWSVATLLHVPKRRLPRVLRSIKTLLTPGGVFILSLKAKSHVDEQVITQAKYGGVSRFFAFYTVAEISSILAQAGFRINKRFRKSEDGNTWISFVCQLVDRSGR